MRIRHRIRDTMIMVALLAASLALGMRHWQNEWAPYYSRQYSSANQSAALLRQVETRHRAAGNLDAAIRARGLAEIWDEQARELLWRWLKAVALDEP
jgi:hypothetical protein